MCMNTALFFSLQCMPSSSDGSISSLQAPHGEPAPISPWVSIGSIEEIGPALGSPAPTIEDIGPTLLGSPAPTIASIALSVCSSCPSLSEVTTALPADDDVSAPLGMAGPSDEESIHNGSDSDIDALDLPGLGGNPKTATAAGDLINVSAEAVEAEFQNNAERLSVP